MSSGVVLADDSTGALECASILVSLELNVRIALGEEPPSEWFPGVLVADTQSRHLPPECAADRVRKWEAHLNRQDVMVYKKTDSTLRGNIGAELEALLELSPSRPVVYLPAYPALHRTVVNGHLYVGGIPVHRTESALDLLQPVRDSAIPSLFREEIRKHVTLVRSSAELAQALRAARHQILICDAESEADMESHAFALAPFGREVAVAGPAGFVRFWAGLASFPRKAPAAVPKLRRWLVVCGSMHPASRRQLNAARALGIDSLESPPEKQQSAEKAAVDLAQAALERIANSRPEAVLIMGGDTARALWQELGIRSLHPLPEILPGVAACRSDESALHFVTKAGAFGEDGLVGQVIERFQ